MAPPVSLCGVVLEWRIAAHGDTLTNPATSPARLARVQRVLPGCWPDCALALVVAAWQSGERGLTPCASLLGMNCNTPTDVMFSFTTGFAPARRPQTTIPAAGALHF